MLDVSVIAALVQSAVTPLLGWFGKAAAEGAASEVSERVGELVSDWLPIERGKEPPPREVLERDLMAAIVQSEERQRQLSEALAPGSTQIHGEVKEVRFRGDSNIIVGAAGEIRQSGGK